MSQKYPNSGILARSLYSFYRSLYPLKILNATNIKVLVSILVDIAYKNPRVYPIICAIIGKLLLLETDKSRKDNIYKAIKLKFNGIPNAGYMLVWLQRITLKINEQEEYDEKICQMVNNEHLSLWETNWAHERIKRIFNDNPIIDKEEIESMTEIPDPTEIKTVWSY